MPESSDSQQAQDDSSIQDLSATSLEDTISLMMQNAVSIQQSMQIVTNTSVASGCALILKQGGG